MNRLIAGIASLLLLIAMVPIAQADDQLQPNEVEYMADNGFAICEELDRDPSPPTVINIAEGVINNGFVIDSAIDIVNYTVMIYCPNWGPLLDETSRVYGNKGPMKRGI